MLLVDRR